jgi:hypothetical protein
MTMNFVQPTNIVVARKGNCDERQNAKCETAKEYLPAAALLQKNKIKIPLPGGGDGFLTKEFSPKKS